MSILRTIKLKVDTPERLEDREFVEKTANVVRSWPSWMRGDYTELDSGNHRKDNRNDNNQAPDFHD